MIDCGPCQLVQRALEERTDVLHTDYWVALPAPGAWPLGTLSFTVRRHVSVLGHLSPSEADEMGGLLTRLAAALMEIHQPSQVYTCQWSHHGAEPSHIHFMVQPISQDDLDRHPGLLGPWLQAALLEETREVKPEQLEAYTARVRTALSQHGQ